MSNKELSFLHKLTLGILATLAAIMIYCGAENPFAYQDAYCMDWCKCLHHGEFVVNAEWHGDDDIINKTRCACTIQVGDTTVIVAHLVRKIQGP